MKSIAFRFRVTIFICILFSAPISTAQEQAVLACFGVHNAEPHAFVTKNRLTDGIMKKIAEQVSERLNIQVQFIQCPRKRLFTYLEQERVHWLVLSNPKWFKQAEKLMWSIPIMEEKNVFVVSSTKPYQVEFFEDLKGKTLGTILGYHYPKLQPYFEEGIVVREDTYRLQQNFEKLKAGRIDLLIDSDILINHYIKSNQAQSHFQIAKKVSSTNKLRSALSPRAPIKLDQLNQTYNEMIADGTIKQILDHYR